MGWGWKALDIQAHVDAKGRRLRTARTEPAGGRGVLGQQPVGADEPQMSRRREPQMSRRRAVGHAR